MADLRSRREKLEAMANQTASPHEAEIARRLLGEMPVESAPSDTFRDWEARADEFVARMTVEYGWSGTTVHYDGAREPGVLGAMLREALRAERAPRMDAGPGRLPDA